MTTTLIETVQSVQKSANKLWKSSILFRVSSIAASTILGLYSIRFTRSIYLRLYKRYYDIPPGEHGTIPFFGVLTQYSSKNLDFFCQLATNYGCIVSVMFGPFTLILINDPSIVSKVFSNPLTTFATEIFTGGRKDIAFAFTNGKSWSQRRRIIFSNLMSIVNQGKYVENATKKFIKTKLFPIFDKNIKAKTHTPIRELFRAIGFNIVLQACFGKELQSFNDPIWKEWETLLQAQKKQAGLQQLFLFFLGGSNILSRFLQRLFCSGDFFDSFQGLIDSLDKFSRDESRNIVNKSDINRKDIKLFSDYVENYHHETDYTRRDLLGDMTVIFFGATDTTYSVLAFALLLAAKYPNIQQELYKEVVNAFGDNVDMVELRNRGITKIPKIRAFIHETLRIFPPVPVPGLREVRNKAFPIVTPNKTYNIPVGSNLVINVVAIGRNPKYWIKNYDPINNLSHKDIKMEQVHLDFWLDNNGKFNKKKNSSSFVAFHYGKRDCVGQALAMKELYIVLSMIFMKYKINSINGTTDFEIKSQYGGVVNEPTVKSVRLEHR